MTARGDLALDAEPEANLPTPPVDIPVHRPPEHRPRLRPSWAPPECVSNERPMPDLTPVKSIAFLACAFGLGIFVGRWTASSTPSPDATATASNQGSRVAGRPCGLHDGHVPDLQPYRHRRPRPSAPSGSGDVSARVAEYSRRYRAGTLDLLSADAWMHRLAHEFTFNESQTCTACARFASLPPKGDVDAIVRGIFEEGGDRSAVPAYEYDAVRFRKWMVPIRATGLAGVAGTPASASGHRVGSGFQLGRETLLAEAMRLEHGLEKGLSTPDAKLKPHFGIRSNKLTTLLALAREARKAGWGPRALGSIDAALAEYAARHKAKSFTVPPPVAAYLDELRERGVPVHGDGGGAVFVRNATEEILTSTGGAVSGVDLSPFFESRHSVREWDTTRPVEHGLSARSASSLLMHAHEHLYTQ